MPTAPRNTREPHFPAPCPRCRAELGYPRKAVTVAHQPDLVRLTVRCDACGDEWTMERDEGLESQGQRDGQAVRSDTLARFAAISF